MGKKNSNKSRQRERGRRRKVTEEADSDGVRREKREENKTKCILIITAHLEEEMKAGNERGIMKIRG